MSITLQKGSTVQVNVSPINASSNPTAVDPASYTFTSGNSVLSITSTPGSSLITISADNAGIGTVVVHATNVCPDCTDPVSMQFDVIVYDGCATGFTVEVQTSGGID